MQTMSMGINIMKMTTKVKKQTAQHTFYHKFQVFGPVPIIKMSVYIITSTHLSPDAVSGEFEDPLPNTEDDDPDNINRTVPIPDASSLFIFGPTNRFRVFCHQFCNHPAFSNFILVCIMVSSAR